MASRDRLRGPGPIVEPSKILAARARARGAYMILHYRQVAFSTKSGMVCTWGNCRKTHRDQRQFRPDREGEASILWDQVGATVGPDQREAVVATFACHQRVDRRWRAVIPDTEAGPMLPRGLLAPPHRARHDPQSCTVIRQVTPSSALMRGRKS